MARTFRLCVAGALAASVVVALPVAADSHHDVVLTGVDNPRGVTFDDAGTLFVASSGIGDEMYTDEDYDTEAADCITGPEGHPSCYGETGAILRVPGAATVDDLAVDGTVTLLPGLPSHAGVGGAEGIGAADVSVGPDGRLYFTIGLGANPAVRDAPADPGDPSFDGAGDEDLFATLQSVDRATGGDLTEEADLGDHETTDPDGQGPDSNPFGVIAGADSATVLDSGGNTMVEVALADGAVSTHTVFPPTHPVPAPAFLEAPAGTTFPAQAVPTQFAQRADGSFDVGQLTGFPFHPGAASVWNVDDDGAEVLQTGFTNVIDVAWHDGDLYVLEIAHNGLLADGPPNGALIRVSMDGATVTRELLFDDVLMPGGMAFDPTDEGMLYVTTGSAGPDGTVIRFDTTTAEPLLTVVDDDATTEEDERLVAGDAEADAYQSVTEDVAANDEGVTSVSVLNNSTGAVWHDGSIMYQPPAHFSGEDTVTYRGCNAGGSCLIGTLTVTVAETDVDRIAGGTRIQTAIEASQGRYPDGAPVVIITRSDKYPDALAGGPLAGAVDAPVLLTPTGELHDDVAAEIERLGAGKAYLLGGPVALSTEVEEAVEALVPDTDRLAGADRFATAVEIRDELAVVAGTAADHAYVVEGDDPDPTRGWPDAVAVSALASFEGRPILLVETDRMPDVTADALEGIDATIIGGPVAIGAAVTAAIEEAADTVARIEGDTRYETSRRVAERSFDVGMERPVLTLVSGGNWPDALVGGPLVAKSLGGFMLVHPSDLSQSPPTSRFIDDHGPFEDVDLFGGTVAISPTVEASVAAANGS